MSKKKRISGLYLRPEVVERVEAMRRRDVPVPSFNRKLTQVIEKALCLKEAKRE